MSKRQKLKSTINTPRVLTGIGIGVAILGILALGNVASSHLFFAIAILGCYELAKMARPSDSNWMIYSIVLVGALPYMLLSYIGLSHEHFIYLLSGVCAFFIIMVLDLYRKGHFQYSKYPHFFSFFYWGMSFGIGSYFLKNHEAYVYMEMLGIIFILWTSDTMAYITGRKFGKNKLFPSVSPNKTIEGSLGAGLSCVLLSFLVAYLTGDSFTRWSVIAVIIWIFGTYGDLVESKIKRTTGVKDSGNILPGHGGIMDRFDSLALVIPFLLLFTYLFEK